VCMNPLVKAKHPADFLVALPRMLGYAPTESVVIQTFCSRRTAASLRIDLPDELRAEGHRAVADAIIRLISRVPGVDAVLIAVYTNEAWPSPTVPPRAALIESIVTRMASAGLGIVDALCCTGSRWASYLDSEHGVIDDSRVQEIGQRLDDVGVYQHESEQAQGAPPIEGASAEHRARVAAAASALTNDGDERERLWQWTAAAPLWCDAIESTPSDIPDSVVAALLWSLRDKGVRDCALMHLAWGRDAGERAARDTDSLHRGLGVPPGSILETFVGEGQDAPGGLRVEGAVRLLRHLVSLAPIPWQLAPLTMLAWFEWARGRGSAAGDYLDRALSIGPGYELARLFSQMVSAGRIPDWVGRSPQ
jgi:hypothetical protein